MSTDATPTGPPAAASTVPPAVELIGITKRFPGVVANSDITFSVRRGTVHALVGENGAGKSTLMRIIAGEVEHTSGDLQFARGATVGYLPQDPCPRGVGPDTIALVHVISGRGLDDARVLADYEDHTQGWDQIMPRLAPYAESLVARS